MLSNEDPMRIPRELLSRFTMDGRCAVAYRYIDDSNHATQAEINENFRKDVFDKYMGMARKRKTNYYGDTDKWLYRALRKHPIKGVEVCIFGSANPWYEAVALEHGARRCEVIEYSDRISFDDRITYVKPGSGTQEGYAAAFSISSFEHDGLGRYGDPINPDGDIVAMESAKAMLRKDGLLFLALPVGKDTICYNVHRIYGRHRLPRMLEGWRLLSSFGFDERDLDNDVNNVDGTPYQPVFVLQRV